MTSQDFFAKKQQIFDSVLVFRLYNECTGKKKHLFIMQEAMLKIKLTGKKKHLMRRAKNWFRGLLYHRQVFTEDYFF